MTMPSNDDRNAPATADVPAGWAPKLDAHMWEVVKGASVFISLRGMGAALGFAFNMALARHLGAEGSGVFFLALTVTTMATTLGSLGLGPAMLRFTAANASAGNWGKVSGLYRSGMLIASVALSIAALLVFVLAPSLAGLFHEPSLTAPLRVMAFCSIPLGMINLHSELLRGLKRIRDSVLVMGVGVPAASLAALIVMGSYIDVFGAAVIYTLSAGAVMLMGVIMWRRGTPMLKGLDGRFDRSELLNVSIPLFWVTAINMVTASTGAIVLGLFAGSRSVGVYTIAAQTAALTSFILLAVNSIAAPKFAELHARGDSEALGSLARDAAKMVTVVAAPVQALFILAPAWALGFFGADFTSGAAALAIMATGHFINVATGSVGYLLIMSGNERLLRNNTVAWAVLNIILASALAPGFGVTGVAFAMAASLAGQNIISAVIVYKKLSILTLPLPERFVRK